MFDVVSTRVSLYNGGFSSDSSSLIGPYILIEAGWKCVLKKDFINTFGAAFLAIYHSMFHAPESRRR